jgi:hypothetical protein
MLSSLLSVTTAIATKLSTRTGVYIRIWTCKYTVMCSEILLPVNIWKHHRLLRLHLVTYFGYLFIIIHLAFSCYNRMSEWTNGSTLSKCNKLHLPSSIYIYSQLHTQNQWVCGLCRSSRFLNYYKTQSFENCICSVFGWRERDTFSVGSLRNS